MPLFTSIHSRIDDFAELRAAHTNASFFTQLSPPEQAEWVADLAGRTVPPDDAAPAACILDTGVNRGHLLLEYALAEQDLHTCEPAWHVHDHDGHGTGMALTWPVAESSVQVLPWGATQVLAGP
jgi:hypothetical protein